MPRPPLAWLKTIALAAALVLTSRAAPAADAPPKAPPPKATPAARPAVKTSDVKAAADLLPASTLVCVEVTRPKEILGTVLDHPLVKQFQESPDWKKATENPEFKQFMDVVGLIEQRAGVKWRPAVESITGGGITVGFEPATQGAVVLVKSQDPKTTAAVRDAFISLVRDDAKNKGNPDPIQTKEYRGLTAYVAGDVRIADMGPYLMVSNKSTLATNVADRFLDGGSSLAATDEFKAARALAFEGGSEPPAAWAYVSVAPLRKFGVAKELLDNKDKSDNPGAEFLLGGLLADLRQVAYVTASARLDKQSLKVSVAMPHDKSWVPPERKFFFAPGGGGAEPPLKPKDTILAVSTYRDLAAMWQAAPDLFTEGAAAEMAKKDSEFNNLLGGKSFSNDILPSLAPQMQFVATRQDFKAAGVPVPTTQLPAGAFVFRLKDGQRKVLEDPLNLFFQFIVTFANADASQKQRPMLFPKTETRGKAEISYATYKARDPKDMPKDNTYLNFSPAMVVSDTHVIICSTKALAEELADLTAKAPAKAAAGTVDNTRIEMDGKVAAELLKIDREPLIAQNMLEKGHDRAAAEKEIGVLVALVDFLRDAKVRLAQTDKAVRLEVEVKTAQ